MDEEKFNDAMCILASRLDEISHALKAYKVNGNKDYESLYWLYVEITCKVMADCFFRINEQQVRLSFLDVMSNTIDGFRDHRLNEGLN